MHLERGAFNYNINRTFIRKEMSYTDDNLNNILSYTNDKERSVTHDSLQTI